jgi:sulfur-oxidizing protein SoxB
MGHRIQDMRLNGQLLDANKTYKVAGWAPVSEAARDKGGEPIWDLVARHLRAEKVVKVSTPNVPKLKGVASNLGMV